jgi:hypothetical protein
MEHQLHLKKPCVCVAPPPPPLPPFISFLPRALALEFTVSRNTHGLNTRVTRNHILHHLTSAHPHSHLLQVTVTVVARCVGQADSHVVRHNILIGVCMPPTIRFTRATKAVAKSVDGATATSNKATLDRWDGGGGAVTLASNLPTNPVLRCLTTPLCYCSLLLQIFTEPNVTRHCTTCFLAGKSCFSPALLHGLPTLISVITSTLAMSRRIHLSLAPTCSIRYVLHHAHQSHRTLSRSSRGKICKVEEGFYYEC